MLSDAEAIRLAIHEHAHQCVAEHHGIVAMAMLHVDGRARCYLEIEPTGLADRQLSAAGHLAEFILATPGATARSVWHAYCAGRINFGDPTDPTSDAAHAAPITRNLLATTLGLVRKLWPQISTQAQREARVYLWRAQREAERKK
jgi:hypothetical protein